MKKNQFHTFSTGVFDRTLENGESTLSENKFYWIIALGLARWFWLTAYFAHLADQINFQPSIILAILIWLVLPICGIFLAIKSDNPILSFIGYNMVVIPFWFTMWPILNEYSPEVIRNAMWITWCITVIMWWLGAAFPNIFKKLWWILFIALWIFALLSIGSIFIPQLNLEILDYIGAWIFSLYVWYDMYRASSLQRTVDNAIDLCVDFYLDIINLFIEILKITWRRD